MTRNVRAKAENKKNIVIDSFTKQQTNILLSIMTTTPMMLHYVQIKIIYKDKM